MGKAKRKKRDVILYLCYAACMVMAVSFFIYVCLNVRNSVFSDRSSETFRRVTEYTSFISKDPEAPIGVRQKYMMQILDISRGGGSLVFYSMHECVDVYIGDELVYSMSPSPDNPFGRTPGSNWNTVLLSQEDNGKKIEVILTPVYKDYSQAAPKFYMGSRYLIWMEIFRQNALSFLISLVAIVFGVIFILYTLVNSYNNPSIDKSLAVLGLFSILIGLWKLSDSTAMTLLFQTSIPLAYFPYLVLLLLEVPFFLYVRSLFSRKHSLLWYVPCFASVAVCVACVVMQATGIADFHETLWMCHLVMALMIVAFFYMLLRERKAVGWSRQLRILVRCAIICVVGMSLDMASYYLSEGMPTMIMGMLAFLVYIVVLGAHSLRENQRMVRMAANAKRYERMAYHDQLTGVFNRTAYAEHTQKKGFSPEGCIIVMFDLNNLKKCNDTFGHEKGDRYIKYSAKLILKAFGDIGNCYRMGGDEFCVLLKGVSVEECRKRILLMKKAAEASNERHPEEFPIRIASGYETYDKSVDYDLGDTLRRADKMMYHEKFMMKQEAPR